jgi:cysteine-rich repeat protein
LDFGNMVDTDACLSSCKQAACGDNQVQAGVEECDDGNVVDTDACTAACKTAKCGDAVVQVNVDECDDGNMVDTDACLNTCKAAKCGDSVVQAGVDECDDGNMVDTDACLNNCKAAKCGDGVVQANVEACDDGNMVDNDACSNACKSNVKHANCADILTNMNMWGTTARGVDLRAWTGSTLHYIGCNGNGCNPNDFYCTFDMATQKLAFGSTVGTVRAAVDPGNALGDTMPNSFNGCCNGPLGLCNAPDSNNNGVPVDMVDALCNALGYQTGFIKRQDLNSNFCPEAHVTDAAGLAWTSDFVQSNGYGAEYECTTFK